MTDGDGERARTLTIRSVSSLSEVAAEAWDACAAPEAADGGRPDNPFLTHRFLSALEESRSVHPRAGWAPHHMLAEDPDGALLGVMPLYAKGHSQGEYVFDYAWADAFQRAGGAYYPKLQAAVPFTPATGRRLLARPDSGAGAAAGGATAAAVERALLSGAIRLAASNDLSSLHLTFCTEEEWRRYGADELEDAALLRRQDQQFHWRNRGYESFDAFLEALASRKRKQLRKERERAVSAGVTIRRLTGDDITPGHWDVFWRFYQDTGARKWGAPYLTRAFFEIAHASMREDILLVMCERDGAPIAGALNFIGRRTLFGRYWGCVEDHPFLHFETCYYQAIDFAIAHGLKRVEAGAQGGHKLARGYEPVTTRSIHYIPNAGFRDAVARFLEGERRAVEAENQALGEMTPFRKDG